MPCHNQQKSFLFYSAYIQHIFRHRDCRQLCEQFQRPTKQQQCFRRNNKNKPWRANENLKSNDYFLRNWLAAMLIVRKSNGIVYTVSRSTSRAQCWKRAAERERVHSSNSHNDTSQSHARRCDKSKSVEQFREICTEVTVVVFNQFVVFNVWRPMQNGNAEIATNRRRSNILQPKLH